MHNSIQLFSYENQDIEFDLSNEDIIVNASEMAKIFDAKVNDFIRNEQTKRFITECLKNGNSRFISIKKKEDLVTSRQRSGTWMHRILALKFAAWLSPAFELWVFSTIEDILFSKCRQHQKYINECAIKEARIKEIRAKYMHEEDFREMLRLTTELRQASYRRNQELKNQVDQQIYLFDSNTETNE